MLKDNGPPSQAKGFRPRRARASDADSGSAPGYQSFMAGYVRRINEATLRVAIGGVRIGSARYSRLAQINLKTRIITFSRFAIENVPERGRRYLVIHELAHVKEASHNKRFWDIVATYEPDYKRIGRELDQAFKKNVTLLDPASDAISSREREDEVVRRQIAHAPVRDLAVGTNEQLRLVITAENALAEEADDGLFWGDDEFEVVDEYDSGIIYGGSELDFDEIGSF